jgi:transposase-like protein
LAAKPKMRLTASSAWRAAYDPLLVAISVNADGYRQILGIVEGAKEDRD